ncbi:MAG: glycosyltransferase 87 family protein [Pseudomonadota bacterium]
MANPSISRPARSPWPGWLALAALLLTAAAAARFVSPLFGRDVALGDMPIVLMVACYCGLCLIALLALPALIKSSSHLNTRSLLILILLAGLAMRLSQLGATPILEDDHNRYLWDGAVTVSGQSPFAASPEAVAISTDPSLQALKDKAGLVFEDINYPEYRTVYPPVAQAAFALSHIISPFSLDAWRVVLIALELAAMAFMIAILRQFGRSDLWCALYWWNPLIIKELANSAHMEPVLLLPLVAGVWAALVLRPVWASGLLAVAAGVKLWPIVLSANLFRRLLDDWRTLAAAAGLAAFLLLLFAWPVVQAGLGSDSGFVAYAQKWRASSASFLVAEWVVHLAPQTVLNAVDPGMLTRGLLAALLAGAFLVILHRRACNGRETVWQMFALAAALYLLSPSQFPWYFVWIAPFLCVFPVRGLLLAGALLPLHYLYFHFAARDLEDAYRHGIVWLIWLPVWALLLFDWVRARAATTPLKEENYASQS